jgi:hypothetical protein
VGNFRASGVMIARTDLRFPFIVIPGRRGIFTVIPEAA